MSGLYFWGLYDGKISIINRSALKIYVSLFENTIFGDDNSEKKCISDTASIVPDSEGHITIPDTIDWKREFPILDFLNERHVKIMFEDGEETMFPAGKLYLFGNNKDKIIITSYFYVTFLSDPSLTECDKISASSINLVDQCVLNDFALEKLGIGTLLF